MTNLVRAEQICYNNLITLLYMPKKKRTSAKKQEHKYLPEIVGGGIGLIIALVMSFQTGFYQAEITEVSETLAGLFVAVPEERVEVKHVNVEAEEPQLESHVLRLDARLVDTVTYE